MQFSHVRTLLLAGLCITAGGCKKGGDDPTPPPPPPAAALALLSAQLDNAPANASAVNYNVRPTAVLKLSFNNAVKRATVAGNISLLENGVGTVPVTTSYERNDSVIVLSSTAPLKYLTRYTASAGSGLQSVNSGSLASARSFTLQTQIDSSRKFPLISDDALLDKVQQQTFKYFWDFGHPVSGLARERNSSGDVVTSGGSGFAIMAIITAIHRGFITRSQGFTRLQTMVAFLKNTAQTFHGAYPHWLNGSTGAVVPFSQKDNGADLVETSYLVQGLLCARQYFDASGAEATLRTDINTICNRVEWDWFRNGGQNTLYWHWSPNYNWEMNLQIRGWNECLVTYVLAASSTTHGIPAAVYNNGWKGSASYLNGNTYYGYTLPLGPAQGGPLFFSHYSFMGINPNGLLDASANYATQTRNHTLINYNYSRSNPQNYFGYSDSVWGLTASDIQNGYTASSPTNDVGVIAPTAALASFPYTPAESMAALKFYYYVLGDKLFKEYG
ncbi:MAG: beta-glucosidase, partial [Chitinophagaceae bacterium]